MIQNVNFSELQYVYGGKDTIDCNCLDVNYKVVSNKKAKNKNDCWKACCSKDEVTQIYARYGDIEGTCMVEKDYIDFLKWKAGKKK